MSTPQSIRAFADDARASLAELDKALGSKEAVEMLRHGGALDWADAVIPNADLAVERAMLDAPAAADFGAEGWTGGKEKDKRKNDTREQPVGLLPAPKETSKERGSNREASAETQFAARERRTATATKTTTATTATTDDASFLDASVLPTATAASLERAGALARAEAAAPLRCLRERDAVKQKGLASRKKRRRYKNGDDVFEVAADARADKCAARTSTKKDVKRKPYRLTPGEDVVISVGIHNPAKPAMVLEEFLCLGSDSLAELKDRVTCAADEQAVEVGLPKRERRGFFFVEGVFHEDARDVGVMGDEGNEEGEEEGGVGGTEEIGEKDARVRGQTRRRENDGADVDDDAENPETKNPYAAPVAAFHASVIKELGAGAHRRFAAPGERAFVAEASTSAREAAVAEALKRENSNADDVSDVAARARAEGAAAARAAASAARRRPPPRYEIGGSCSETRFDSLRVVRGKPYCMRHRGDCDHVVTIRGARLAHADDELDAAAYPLRVFAARAFRRKCNMCSLFEASVVTRADAQAPCSPCFFCASCFECLHRKTDGTDAYSGYEKYAYYHE
jgi:snRNA-activating protein complex subunit 3